MTLWTAPKINENISYEELVDLVARLSKDVAFILNGNIDSRNTREIGGYIVSPNELMSKNGQVGFSSIETSGNDVRIWAGDADMNKAPFRVYENGYMVATNGYFTGSIEASDINGGTVTGALIQTSESSYPRIELSSSSSLLTAWADPYSSLGIYSLFTGNNRTAIVLDSPTNTSIIWELNNDLYINSDTNLFLSPNNYVKIGRWSYFRNENTGRTLQQDLDSLDTRITALGG